MQRSVPPTVDEWPAGYRHDFDQGLLGSRARDVRSCRLPRFEHWQAHTGAGTEVFPRGGTVAEGEVALLLVRAAGLWTVAPFRIVYVVEEPETFRFAYGTLPGHPEQGEASFAVVRSETDDVFFRPRILLAAGRPARPPREAVGAADPAPLHPALPRGAQRRGRRVIPASSPSCEYRSMPPSCAT